MKYLCKIPQKCLWSSVKKPVASLKHKFSHMVRRFLPLAGVSPWSSAGLTVLRAAKKSAVGESRQGRASQTPGLAGTRQPADTG